jgi:uncharacterized protein (DUF1330 family)
MPAFVIVDVLIDDPLQYEAYKRLTPDTIAAFDGRFVVRGGKTTVLEGGWNPERIVVLEFPSVQRAQEWWDSELYSPAKEIRQKSARTKMIIVQGV